MKRLLILIPLVFLCCFTAGCEPPDEAIVKHMGGLVHASDIQTIKDIVAEWETAVNAADIDKLLSFYATDAVEIPPNEPAIIGKEAIRNNLQEMFEEMTPREENEVKAVHVSGDLAVAHVAWSWIATTTAGEEQLRLSGNWIINLKKQPDGAWNFIYSIFSNESLIFPDEAE